MDKIEEEVISLLRATLQSCISIKVETEPDLSPIFIDPIQLHQIIMNLCINARDAIDGEGEIKIKLYQVMIDGHRCSSCHEDFSGEYLSLVVNDNGHGIKQDVLDRMFDPFFTTKEVGRGTGIGLSVVHGIVHQHDGHIKAVSYPDVGTGICIYFPIPNSTDINSQKCNISA